MNFNEFKTICDANDWTAVRDLNKSNITIMKKLPNGCGYSFSFEPDKIEESIEKAASVFSKTTFSDTVSTNDIADISESLNQLMEAMNKSDKGKREISPYEKVKDICEKHGFEFYQNDLFNHILTIRCQIYDQCYFEARVGSTDLVDNLCNCLENFDRNKFIRCKTIDELNIGSNNDYSDLQEHVKLIYDFDKKLNCLLIDLKNLQSEQKPDGGKDPYAVVAKIAASEGVLVNINTSGEVDEIDFIINDTSETDPKLQINFNLRIGVVKDLSYWAKLDHISNILMSNDIFNTITQRYQNVQNNFSDPAMKNKVKYKCEITIERMLRIAYAIRDLQSCHEIDQRVLER